MMKKFKQFIASVLALCMLFSLSVAAFAAEPEAHTTAPLTKKLLFLPKQPPPARSLTARLSGN